MKLKSTKGLEMDLRKIWKLLHGRRAVSVAVSNVILTGAVIAVSFVVLAWAQYRSSAYEAEYGEVMNADIAKLKERLMFEYVTYDPSGNLTVYLMNCGTIDVTIQTVSVNNTAVSIVESKFLNGTSNPTRKLDRGEDGCFVLSVKPVAGNSYSVEVKTGRESTFETTFIA